MHTHTHAHTHTHTHTHTHMHAGDLLAKAALLKSQSHSGGSEGGEKSRQWGVGGAAWGGYARKIIQPYLLRLAVRVSVMGARGSGRD